MILNDHTYVNGTDSVSDFDCDPQKGATGSDHIKVTHTFMTDLSKKNPSGDDSEENRNIPMANVDADQHRYMWIKAYGCMLYVDNPSYDGDAGNEVGQAGDTLDGTAQGDISANGDNAKDVTTGTEVPAEALSSG